MFARKDTKATDVRYSEKFRFHPIAYSEVIVHWKYWLKTFHVGYWQ